jgi:[protein-PII] uridylyltransferase
MKSTGDPVADRAWIEAQLKQFPERYVYGTVPARIAAHLAAVSRLHQGDVVVETDFNRPLGTCEYSVITHNELTPGIFSKITGVMAGNGLQILDAQILTRADGIVVDTFQVTAAFVEVSHYISHVQIGSYNFHLHDRFHQHRLCLRSCFAECNLDGFGDRIAAVLKGWEHVDEVIRRGARLRLTRPLPKAPEATEVRIDNETSDSFTIVDVFADDRQGLLHVITNAIFQLGLSIHAARISTRLDQVADVFYVTDQAGKKLSDHAQVERVRAGVEQAVEQFLVIKAA